MEIKIGIPVSPGIAIGTVHLLGSDDLRIAKRFIRKDEVRNELERWESSKEQARQEIESLLEGMRKVVKDEIALVFDTHIRILDDPSIQKEIVERIKVDRYSPEYAVSRTFRKIANTIRELEDSYFGQRVSDFIDVQRRLLKALSGSQADSLEKVEGEVVVIAYDLTPSQTASFARGQVLAFGTDQGGATSHTAILANALNIPAVVGLGDITQDLSGGETIIIDGSKGRVIVNPDPATHEKYQKRSEEYRNRERRLLESATGIADETADGVSITFLGNIEFEDETATALECGASGLGLYRTEFIFARHQNPSEEDHFQSIMKALNLLDGRPLTLRTLDFGADKFAEIVGLQGEENPFLGNRSLRLCLQRPEIFRVQLRAIYRASHFGDLRLMLPMVGSLDELYRAKTEIESVCEELSAEGIVFNPKVPIGIMIEVPSAALTADCLAKEVDFFSIGTNDLVQYTLAVDRNNPSVSHLYNHTHPAVLGLIQKVIDVSHEQKIPLSVCGEMAGDVELAILLLGMGVRTFSCNPSAIPGLKTAFHRITLAQAEEIAKKCFELKLIEEIDAYLDERLSELLGEDFGYASRRTSKITEA